MRHGERPVDAFGGGSWGIWLKACVLLTVTCSVALGAGKGDRTQAKMTRAEFEARQLFVKVWEPGIDFAAVR